MAHSTTRFDGYSDEFMKSVASPAGYAAAMSATEGEGAVYRERNAAKDELGVAISRLMSVPASHVSNAAIHELASEVKALVDARLRAA